MGKINTLSIELDSEAALTLYENYSETMGKNREKAVSHKGSDNAKGSLQK